ncbi:apoptosis-associated speck-like protein containing a CARD [Trichomycterus rosablanca]|uniref:apoptosis-associated speck-like protein containing a CARD n=1 Tax=Trichomycterus rosablanca TaxID=2290929 RepID=UPI002F35F6D2
MGQSNGLEQQDAEFIDQNQDKLIQRACGVDPILDQLLGLKVINAEEYSDIQVERTSQEKMRALLMGPMRADGDSGKAKLYEILMKEQPHLMEDLQAASGNVR